MSDRVKAFSKQVQLDGCHLADAATPDAAEVIAICLRHAGTPWERWNPEDARKVQAFFA